MAPTGAVPAGRRIAECRLEDRVIGHRKKPGIDLTLFTPANTVHRRLHIVVDAAIRNATEDPKPMPMGVKHRSHRGAIGPSPMAEVMGLQGVSPQQKSPAVGPLDMGDRQLCLSYPPTLGQFSG